MARRIADVLLGEELVLRDVEPKDLAAAIEPLIFEELMVEDRLNDEIREMMRSIIELQPLGVGDEARKVRIPLTLEPGGRRPTTPIHLPENPRLI